MNFGDKLKQLVSTVAPTLGAALGGPFGGLAGTVLAKWLGKDGQPADQQTIETMLTSGDPDALLKLKQADNEFKEHMKALGIQEEQLVYADIANARNREIQVKDNTPRQLAWMIIGGFIAISFAQIWAMVGYAEVISKIPPQGWLLIGNISGYLANEAKQAAAYYFGSSMGSQAKDATLADIAKS